MRELELWGGPECSVNRTGDRFRDQLVHTGHQDRVSDLDRFAALGVAALRYPVLWERVAPDAPDQCDWRWTDERLQRLRALNIRPIVGLVHHGSGPRYTDLLADSFATGLGRFAGTVAERYPWVQEWTPINEPVTTARFSALYGHWYPHQCDERSFWIALVNQIDGIRHAMRAIRAINPAARLIQTDDLGRTYATASVRDQAAFDNMRRWMGWDLLCGRVTPAHPLWRRLCGAGLEDRLRAIADDPCPPDVIGVNHYLTSDRFLDHRLQRYPSGTHGSNGRQRYADTEAVRVLQPPPSGFAGVLREAWRRYGIPVAATEVHNGCTREEQMRWTAAIWEAAIALRREGVDIRAITSWALVGSKGWNTLLTETGLYEPGAFDVSSGTARPTALAGLLEQLTGRSDAPAHPVLAAEGWWHRPIRLHHAAVPRPAPMRDHIRRHAAGRDGVPKLLILGATGTLGRALAAACRHRAIGHELVGRDQIDLTAPDSIATALDRHRPWAVINAAGWVRIDDGEAEAEACMRVNASGAVALAAACDTRGIPSVTMSSNLVFDGAASTAYLEQDRPTPLSVYGRSKAQAEAAIATLAGAHLIVRSAAFFSPFDPHNFAAHLVGAAREGRPFAAAADQIVSPTYVPDLCNAILDLVIDGETGTWHLTNGEGLSWAAFAHRLAETCALDSALIRAVGDDALGQIARRPAFAALASERGVLLPPLQTAIDRFADEMRRSGALADPAVA